MSSSTDDPGPDPSETVNFFDPQVAANPQPVLRRLRERCPVGNPIPGGGVCLSRYEDVMYALRHPEIFSSAMPGGLLGNRHPLIPLQVDPPEQVKYRKFLDPLFSHRKMLEMEGDVRALASEIVSRFSGQEKCEFNTAFAIPYPCTVFLRLMGLPQSDLDFFLEVKDGIIRPEAKNPEDAAPARIQAGERMYGYFEGVLAERRKAPGDDLLSLFLEAEVGGQKMSQEDLLEICFLFLIAGLDTVTATLGCSVAYLAQHADRRRAVVENPELIPSAIEELLRWETPVVQVVRILTQDITIAGVELKQGEAVTLVLGAADTDDAHFPEADEVRFERSPNKHLAFGGGVHRCLGSHLARMELRVALEEFHRAVPVYSLEPGQTPVYTPGIREVSYLPLVFQETAP